MFATGLLWHGFAPAATPGGTAPEFTITLRPLTGPDGRTITRIDVTETVDPALKSAGPVLLELADVTFNVPSAGGQIRLLAAHDAQGPLQLTAQAIGEGDTGKRQWLPDRATQGPITIRYRVPVEGALAPRGAAPPIELRNETGAVSGSGATFLLRPPGGRYLFRVHWDLAALPAGATAVSSLGYGPVEPLPADTLDSVYFMAGDLGVFPTDAGAHPDRADFFSAWQGHPPFDAPELMATARTLRERFIAFFDADRSPYGIMLRPNPVNPGGGIGLHRSFVVTFDDRTDVTDLEFTLSHEMFHTFQPRLDGGGEPNTSLANAWFNEGLAVFYQREFLLRAGLIDTATYLEDLNRHAARYYTNALADTPNRDVPAGFWRDTRIRTLPYDRGFLYFATVDHTLRRASDNRRSLDDLVREMRRLQNRGDPPAQVDWEAIIRRELGEDGIRALHAMLGGAAPLPASDAFGPCFRRTTKMLQRYELGFEPAVLTEPERIVRGLVAGSAAERVGLRNGDRILKPVPQDAIQGNQQATLTLEVRRGDRAFTLTYRPRGETVSAWQWERVIGIPEAACRSSRNTTDSRRKLLQ